MTSIWKRLLAYALDALILGIVGSILGYLFFDFFVGLGQQGRLVGFVISLFYFGSMNSVLANGQTVGKRIMKIRVADVRGNPLSIGKSYLRFTILGLPFFCNGLQMPLDALAFNMAVTVIVFGLGGAIIYLMIFNRRTKQSLHDLVVGSYVVNVDAAGIDTEARFWKGHYIVVGILILLSGLTQILTLYLLKFESVKEIVAIQKAINAQPQVQYSSVMVGKQYSQSTKNTAGESYLASNIILSKKSDNPEKMATQFANLILTTDPKTETKDNITIIISHGYNIGIASAWERRNYRFSPIKWKNKCHPEGKKMVQREELRAAALRLKEVLEKSASIPMTHDLFRDLKPLIEEAISPSVICDMNEDEMPWLYNYREGELDAYPEINGAYSVFIAYRLGWEELLD